MNWLPADTTKHHQRVKYDFNSSFFLQYNGSLNLIHKCHIAFMMPEIQVLQPSVRQALFLIGTNPIFLLTNQLEKLETAKAA